jgi:hypothetical protein
MAESGVASEIIENNSDPFFLPLYATRRLSIAVHWAVPSLACGWFDSQQVSFCSPDRPLKVSRIKKTQRHQLVSSSSEREILWERKRRMKRRKCERRRRAQEHMTKQKTYKEKQN